MRVYTLLLTTTVWILASIAMAPAGHAASFTQPTFVRQIGQAGHAFVYPWGLATAMDGTLLTSDYNNFNIKRFTTSGSYVGAFGSSGTGPGQFNQPYSVAVDPNDGSIYVADPVQHQVLKFNPSGSWLYSINVSAPDLTPYVYIPYLTVAANGWVYVVHSHNTSPTFTHRVLVYDSTGNLLNEFGVNGTGAGQFGDIRGIGTDAIGDVIVADNDNGCIQVFDATGHFKYQFGAKGTGPGQLSSDLRGLTVDGAHGWIYVVDAGHATVHKFDTAGNWLLDIGQTGTGPGQLGGARAATIGHDGNIYVSDYANFRINGYTPTGTYLGQVPNPAMGPPNGGFNLPQGIAVDSVNGFVYVMDTFNQRLEQFTLTGTFVRTWGARLDQLLAPDAMDYPRGVAVDPTNQNVWVDDTRAADVKQYTSSGAFVSDFGGSQGTASNQLFYNYGIHVGGNGLLYIADGHNTRIKITDKAGNTQQLLPCGIPNGTGPALYGCTDVTLDSAGNIYAASVNENLIYKWDPSGNLLMKFGTTGSGPGQLSQPYGVVVSGNRLYVDENGNSRISVFDLNGNFIGMWGSKGNSGKYQFNSPKGIAVDSAGLIYVVDTQNQRVEVFQP